MTDLDQGILRPWLDEYEKRASAIKPADPGFDAAQEILGIIANARASLHPSADSTANFLENKEIILQLATLRNKVDDAIESKPK